MTITAKDVNELRRRTGAGMMDCKKALTESKGDFEQAIKLLKEWGITKAAKKSGREASEGVLVAALSSDKKSGALIEVNCETDFVANTPDFRQFAKDTGLIIFNKKFDSSTQFDDEVKHKINDGITKFGENIIVNSIKKIAAKSILGFYIHTNFKNGTIIALDVDGDIQQSELLELANNLAIHTSANQVVAVSKENIDPKIIEIRKQEYTEETKKLGKPENIIPKIVEGKLQKFYKDETLFSQPYLKNEEMTVEQYISSIGKKSGANIKVAAFVKTIIGE